MNEFQQNIISQLLMSNDFESWNCFEPKYYGSDTRTLPFFNNVTKETALLLISQLKHLEELDSESPITIMLNTEGGSLTDGLAIYDTITQLSCPVIVHTLGLCASAGLLILSAGDYRLSSPNTTFYYHQPVMADSMINSMQNMNELNDYYSNCKDITDGIIRARAKIRKSLWTKNFEGKTNFYFDAETALSFNLIDSVTESKKLDYEIEKV
tara:strand:- start:264 stop:896 length:633 start_codon:yes stop_codon:yes gene_type:complete